MTERFKFRDERGLRASICRRPQPQHPAPPSQIPNRKELARLGVDVDTVEQYLRDTFPDVDPPPDRRRTIEALVNVIRAARAYHEEKVCLRCGRTADEVRACMDC